MAGCPPSASRLGRGPTRPACAGNDEAVSVEVTPDAAAFIRQKGGRLYIWVDDAGLLQKATAHPPTSEQWHGESLGDIEVFVGASASEASQWRVRLRRMPW